jgi:DNA (cytosine-5)-methyltransferase 1
MSLTFNDMFCGAGGSTLGAFMAGATPLVGMNHWPVACQSYEANHASAGAQAACVDVITQDPRRYPPADMLLASPECTHHSYARGKPKDDPSLFDPQGDQGAERSRATMWDVVRFAEVHHYRAIIVENVEAAIKWGLPRGAKLKHGDYGPLFAAWLNAMEALGYRYRCVHLNSMVCGVPQSRDRLYVVFWQKGQRAPDLDIPALAWCPMCERLVNADQRWKRQGGTTGTYEQQYYYACPTCAAPCMLAIRPAAAAIDWDLTAPKICDRKTPLKDATLERIRRGLERLRERPVVAHLPDGLVVQIGANTFERLRRDGTTYARAWPVDEAMPTVCGTADRALVLPTTHQGDSQRSRRPGEEVNPTLTAQQELALVYAGRENAVPRRAGDETAHTLTSINSLYVVQPDGRMVLSNMTNNAPRRADDEPAHTISTGGKLAVVVSAGGGPKRDPKPADEPLPTVLGRDNLAVVVTERRHSTPRLPGQDTLDSVTAGGNHHALVVANYGSKNGPANKQGWARHADDEPLGTVTATDSHALLGYVTDEEVQNCTFRMLQPGELKRASGFTPDYFLHGNKREQVCQVGNAVTAPAEAELVRRVIASLEPEGS